MLNCSSLHARKALVYYYNMAEIHFSEHLRFELRNLEAFTIPPRRFEGESDTNYAKRVQRIDVSIKRIEALGFGKLIKSEEEALKAY